MPWPMLPKPTNTILPLKFTCTSCLVIIFFPICFFLGLIKSHPNGCPRPDYLAAYEMLKFQPCGPDPMREELRIAPMRRIGSVVAGKGFDALDPSHQSGVIVLHRQEAGAQFGGRTAGQGAPQHLDPGKYHHVDRRVIRPDDPILLTQAAFDGARFP